MIELTTIVDKKFFLNINLIEQISETPDTVIKLVDDKTLVVKESGKEIVNLIIQFERKIHQKIQE